MDEYIHPETGAVQSDHSPHLQSVTSRSSSDDCYTPLVSDRKRAELQYRTQLKILGDLEGTRRLLQRELQTVLDVQMWVGRNTGLTETRKGIETLLTCLNAKTEAQLVVATTYIKETAIAHKELYISRLESYMNRFRLESCTNTCLGRSTKHTEIHKLQHLLSAIKLTQQSVQQKKGPCSDLEFLCNHIGVEHDLNNVEMLATDNESMAAVKRAVKDVGVVMQDLLVHSLNDSELFLGTTTSHDPPLFPTTYYAAQLAYRTNFPSVAVKLWSALPAERQSTDILQRNLPHLAVEATDLQTLQDLWAADSNIFEITGTDVFGFSLLALAAIRGKVPIFDYLSQRGAPLTTFDHENRSVLALACLTGNRQIVELILKKQLFCPPLLTGLYYAIEGGHEHVANLLMPVLIDPTCFDQAGMFRAAKYAESKGMQHFAHELRVAKPSFGCASNARLALENMRYAQTLPDQVGHTMVEPPKDGFPDCDEPQPRAAEPLGMYYVSSLVDPERDLHTMEISFLPTNQEWLVSSSSFLPVDETLDTNKMQSDIDRELVRQPDLLEDQACFVGDSSPTLRNWAI